MKRIPFFIFPLLCLTLFACKSSPKKENKFFPVASYLKSQVAQVDSTLNTIKKYIFIDSLRTDTLFIHREQFRQEAADFLNIPDLTNNEYTDRFTESNQFDETLNRAMIILTPVDPSKEHIQQQQVLIKPDPSGDKVTNIVINTIINTKDSTVEKKMMWKVDQSFQVTTIRQYKGQPETTSTYKVAWGEDE